ncbi:hypothetical protein EV702DRAFT_1091879 [Suillus placidus]|uniref:DUF6533 domain-containing protein n=1 Tax=Suillus placidus TaxID=48579 RepID=A0A9P6ZXU8_9AGAM|nr:hypothetical protein EV702DRAFT_1091879 [Suillus placidus]
MHSDIAAAIWTSDFSGSTGNPLNMTLVSNDPSWWPLIDFNLGTSYVTVASSTMLVYDWALMFGQEKHDFSVMTVLYLCVRYGGISYSLGNIIFIAQSGICVVENAILGGELL